MNIIGIVARLKSNCEQKSEQKAVGKTKAVGFQFGMRKTFFISLQQPWDLITSDEAIKIWLGDISDISIEEGKTYSTKDGTVGEFRVVKPYSHIRLTWRPKNWEKTFTIQIRVIQKESSKTVISFHQENLLSENEREIMSKYWLKVMEEMGRMVK